MLNKVEANEFKTIIQAGICCDINYLASIPTKGNLKPVYYIYTIENEAKIGFALYQKFNKIVIPEQLLFYSGIWVKDELLKDEFNINFYEAISQLKKLYVSIKLVIATEITDLRPFLWNNFEVKVRYTYCKATQDNIFSEGINRDYKRALKKFHLSHTVCLFNDINWTGYSQLFKKLNYSNTQIKAINSWLINLEINNFLLCINIYNNQEKCLGSGIVLLDKTLKKGYFIFMDISKSQNRSETNSYIYIELQKWLFENGYEEFDYIGANTNTIAKYKSRYHPKLKPYYVVNYNKYHYNIILYFKKFAKTIYNYLLK